MAKDDILEIKFQDGRIIKFDFIASVAYKGNLYALLQPIEKLNGIDLVKDNLAMVFKVTKESGGLERYDVETNQETIDAVFKEYQKIIGEN